VTTLRWHFAVRRGARIDTPVPKHACRLIASYVDGLPHVAVSITAEDHRPVVELSDNELMAIAARGRIDRDELNQLGNYPNHVTFFGNLRNGSR
jgi:hypothetical protein